MINDSTQYIARISYGKDSLKMLDVIKSRGLPLDRITTTDVWATDTIPANLPEMMEFKARMDQIIWSMYHIEVEHLCAINKDGSKKTYEQMFYHVPVRRSQIGQGERERERERDGLRPGSILGFPDLWNRWCQSGLKRNARVPDPGKYHWIPSQYSLQLVSKAQDSMGGEIRGFPLATGVTWCQNLKIRAKESRDIPCENLPGAKSLKSIRSKPLFSSGHHTRCRKRNIVEYLGIAADEPDRFNQLNARKRAPLVEFGIDEDLCGLYCQYADMLAPTYETSCRDGCWFCHNQGVDQLRHLRRNYPDLWALLMKWDLDSPVTFKADGHTVHDFDRRFQLEDERKVPTNRSFRWSMLDKPPKFVAWECEPISFI